MAATLEQPRSTAPTNPYAPIDWQAYEQEKADRAKARFAKRSIQRRCLDPDVAAQEESKKPLLAFKVNCKWYRPDAKGRLQEINETATISAQNESDAWAKFCDKVKDWPSRHACDLTIKQIDSK